MHTSFPLYPSASRLSEGSFNGAQQDQDSDPQHNQQENNTQQDRSESNTQQDRSESDTQQGRSEGDTQGDRGESDTQQGQSEGDTQQDQGDSNTEQDQGTQQDQGENETKPLENGTAVHENGQLEPVMSDEVLDVQDVDIKVSDDEKDLEVKCPDDLSTEDLLDSLQAIQDENMKTFEELVGKLAIESIPETKPSISRLNVSSPQLELMSSSLPSSHASDFMRHREFFEARSASPLSRSRHSRSQSGDHILNPDRTESDV